MPAPYAMLGSLESHTDSDGACLCLDSAYLARALCNVLDAAGLTPYR